MIIHAQDYVVEVGSISGASLQSILTDKNIYSSIFILVDENTHEHCLSYILYQISGLERAQIIEIPSGEENKVLDICYQIWYTLTENQADRKSLLINLGGGVIGDMGGFVASAYKRGIDFINIPTTLLAQVDASVGGKVAIDFEGMKNQVGLFSNPKGVFIDVNFLETLDERQIKSGIAEMLKHGLISDKQHWNNLKTNPLKNYRKFIADSIKIKNEIVLKDPKEINIRKQLNFGHTVGHAVETYFLTQTNEPLLHGEAIAIGMLCESILSKKVGLSDVEFDEIKQTLISLYTFPPLPSEEFSVLISFMKNDKKNSDGNINFTLLSEIGSSVINQFVSEKKIEEALYQYNLLLDL